MSAHSCVLSNLGNPLLNGLGLGLAAAEDGQLRLQTDMFPCCSGAGRAWDGQRSGIRTCTLQARLLRVQKLYAHYKKLWPQATRQPHQVPTPFSSLILQEVAAVLKRDKAGTQIAFTGQKNMPSLAWSKAVAALWRFGVEARVLNLTRSDNKDLAHFTRDHEGPLALFVEQIDKLWDPMHAEALEHLVQRAYNADAFLWLEFMQEQQAEPESHDDGSVRAEISRRINRKRRTQHPFELISRDCISRLQSMSGQLLHSPSGAS
jgi:hypothetical protein